MQDKCEDFEHGEDCISFVARKVHLLGMLITLYILCQVLIVTSLDNTTGLYLIALRHILFLEVLGCGRLWLGRFFGDDQL